MPPAYECHEILRQPIGVQRERLSWSPCWCKDRDSVVAAAHRCGVRAGRMLLPGAPRHVASSDDLRDHNDVGEAPHGVDVVEEPAAESDRASDGQGDVLLDQRR
jgi:hypothetical protein